MSDFQIKQEWIERSLGKFAPALDATLCDIEIYLDSKNITEFAENRYSSESAICVPAYDLAEWLAENWWPLIWEPRKTEDGQEDQDYVARHSLSSASRGFALPDLRITPNGEFVNLFASPHSVSFADVKFVNRASKLLPRGQVAFEFKNFLERTNARLLEKQITGTDFQEAWDSIVTTDPEEEEYCRYMGALGLSPYAENEMIDTALLDAAKHLDSHVLMDLCLASNESDFQRNVHVAKTAVASAEQNEVLDISPITAMPIPAEKLTTPAYRRGVQAARKIRSNLGIQDTDPRGGDKLFEIIHLQTTQSCLSNGCDENTVTGAAIRDGHRAQVALLQDNEKQRRFAAARSVYAMWTSKRQEKRLLTQAVTRAQQASRAFAAEMMAPIDLIRTRVRDRILYQSEIRNLSEELYIGADVIAKQAVNNGFSIRN